MSEQLPRLTEQCVPPTVLGTAALAALAFGGAGYPALLEHVAQAGTEAAAPGYDRAIACELSFRRNEALALQCAALEHSVLYRLDGQAGGGRPLRMLALLAPGDLMVNTPLDFVTAHTDIRLDLLYLLPGQDLPASVPEHDVAFFAVSEADGEEHDRLCRLFRAWPRPALNDPSHLPVLARDSLPRRLAGIAGVYSPPAIIVSREQAAGDTLPDGGYPVLIRPLHSHAGSGLELLDGGRAMADYLLMNGGPALVLTKFVDYRSNDGQYRKYRVAFIARRPFLCHMAISSHWMVHYLNAGMADSAEKRAEEARAMAGFDQDFGRRHGAALAAVAAALGFDYCSIDCGETPDGRLLVFEADTAAIIHLLDSPTLHPYKPPQMRRVFDAFAAMAGAAANATRSGLVPAERHQVRQEHLGANPPAEPFCVGTAGGAFGSQRL